MIDVEILVANEEAETTLQVIIELFQRMLREKFPEAKQLSESVRITTFEVKTVVLNGNSENSVIPHSAPRIRIFSSNHHPTDSCGPTILDLANALLNYYGVEIVGRFSAIYPKGYHFYY